MNTHLCSGDEAPGWHVFATALGSCGVAWRGERLALVQLPEVDAAMTVTRLLRRFGRPDDADRHATVPSALAPVVDAIRQLLSGTGDLPTIDATLRGCVLADDAQSTFHRAVYAAARAIPPGQRRTYGALATAAGAPGLARAVGQAMARNPWPLVVPCHRVVGADGRMTGFSAHGGIDTKRRLLALEGVREPTTLSLFPT